MATTYGPSRIELSFTVPDLDTLETKESSIDTYCTNRADGSYFTYKADRLPGGTINVDLRAYINTVSFADFTTVRAQLNTWVGNNLPDSSGNIVYREGFAPDPE